jgi:hypothetical protein
LRARSRRERVSAITAVLVAAAIVLSVSALPGRLEPSTRQPTPTVPELCGPAQTVVTVITELPDGKDEPRQR